MKRIDSVSDEGRLESADAPHLITIPVDPRKAATIILENFTQTEVDALINFLYPDEDAAEAED